MESIKRPLLSAITGIGILLFLTTSSVVAEQLSEGANIYLAATQPQPGSKEPEDLEPTPPSPLSFGWDITLASKYLFQGIDYSDGKPVVQPEGIITYKGFSAILWFSHDLDKKVSNEFDLYLQYSQEMENLSLNAGYAHFNYPHREEWDPSQEVYADVSYSTILNPSLSIHYDFDAGKGIYSTLGISHGVETPAGTLSLGSNLFYQSNYYDQTGIPSIEFNTSIEYSISSFTITPSISYFLTWENGDFTEDGPEGPVPDTWLFSINLAQSF